MTVFLKALQRLPSRCVLTLLGLIPDDSVEERLRSFPLAIAPVVDPLVQIQDLIATLCDVFFRDW